MFNQEIKNRNIWQTDYRDGLNSSEGYVLSLSSAIKHYRNADHKFNKRGIYLICMNTFFKIAAGVIGGIAIIASLGGFSRGDNENKKKTIESDDTISDDIFDGNNDVVSREPRKGEKIRRETEQNVRSLQEGLTKASNVLGHISIICNSVVKMFYEDPCIRTTPTTYIY